MEIVYRALGSGGGSRCGLPIGEKSTKLVDLVDMVESPVMSEPENREDVADSVAEIAAAIARTITVTSGRWPKLPGEHPTDRTGVRVLATPDFDVWLLRWPTGTGVTPHDHGTSVGAFSVVHGSLVELRWRGGARTSRLIGPAETVTIGRGVVHDVIGVTDGSLSVHAYSPPLSLMNFYDEDGMFLVRSEAVDASCELEGATSMAGAGSLAH
jgi:hypothetical protein